MRSINVPPFGYKAHNGLDFSRSVKRPHSRLGKMVHYLRHNGPSTREDILSDVFHAVQLVRPSAHQWGYTENGFAHVSNIRGQHSYLFSGAVTCGFITKTRKGNRVLYSYGPMGYMVTI